MRIVVLLISIVLAGVFSAQAQIDVVVYDGTHYFPHKKKVPLTGAKVLLNGKEVPSGDDHWSFKISAKDDLNGAVISVSHPDFEDQTFSFSKSRVLKTAADGNSPGHVPVYLGLPTGVYGWSAGVCIPANLKLNTIYAYYTDEAWTDSTAYLAIMRILKPYPVALDKVKIPSRAIPGVTFARKFVCVLPDTFDLHQTQLLADLRAGGFVAGLPCRSGDFIFTNQLNFKVCKGQDSKAVITKVTSAIPATATIKKEYQQYKISLPDSFGSQVFNIAKDISELDGVCKVSLVPRNMRE